MVNNYNMCRQKKNHRATFILLCIIITLIVFLCIILIFKVFSGSNNKEQEQITTKVTTTASQKTTKQNKENDKEENQTNANGYDYSLPVQVSEAVDNSYFDDAVFIGDSRTEGFMLYTGLSNATYYTHKGLMVNTVFTSPVINMNGQKVSVMDAVKLNSKFKKAYIMLGINELGWAYSNLFVEKYGNIIDTIKQSNPNAQIYIQSLIPVTYSKSSSDKVYNNNKIKEYNQLLQKLAQDKKVYYVNVAEGLAESNGCIPEDSAFDGIHLKKPYCQKWLEYLKTHTVKNN